MTAAVASDFRHNPQAEQRRRAKAAAIARTLRGLGHVPADRRILDSFRRDFERLAGVRRCSDLTWELVWQLLDDGMSRC